MKKKGRGILKRSGKKELCLGEWIGRRGEGRRGGGGREGNEL